MRDIDDERLDITGVVLAGGASRRMGQSKARLVIAGEPLLARVVGRLQHAFSDVLVVGPSTLAPIVPGVQIVQDTLPGQGPLGGLDTALAAMSTSYASVVACDMPFVHPRLALAMAWQAARAQQRADVVAMRSERGLEPLHAVYSRSCLPVVQVRLHGGTRSLYGLLHHLRVMEMDPTEAVRWDPEGLSAFNANTVDEWARAVEIAEHLAPW